MRPNLVPVEFVLGPNWVATAHREEVPVLEEFLERAEGGGQVGRLDAPSFVAAICEWVIASYRAFEAVEAELEELDAKVRSVCAAWLFWAVVGMMLGIAATVLRVARVRHWI